jgi:ABC-2 type transport system ATP-binding protein
VDIVIVENLRYEYPGPRPALRDVSFSVKEGEIFGVLGPNGGGKSTLFRVLATLLKPSAGRASVAGADVRTGRAAVRRALGVVFQNPSLDKKLTVAENLWCHGRLHGLGGPALKARLDELLGRFGLAARRNERTETLSGGLRRRVEVAKALSHRPKVLLMDEPSTGLDPAVRREMWTELAGLSKEGVTVLLTTHLMDEAENCGRLLLLDEGRGVAMGTPAELKARIGGDVIRLETREPEELARRLKARFGDGAASSSGPVRQAGAAAGAGSEQGRPLAAAVVDGTVVIERRDGHALIPQLVESFPGLIDSVRMGKPTLEDVFVHETGRNFEPAPRSAHRGRD